MSKYKVGDVVRVVTDYEVFEVPEDEDDGYYWISGPDGSDEVTEDFLDDGKLIRRGGEDVEK